MIKGEEKERKGNFVGWRSEIRIEKGREGGGIELKRMKGENVEIRMVGGIIRNEIGWGEKEWNGWIKNDGKKVMNDWIDEGIKNLGSEDIVRSVGKKEERKKIGKWGV